MRNNVVLTVALCFSAANLIRAADSAPVSEPQVVGTFPENEADVVRLPDGTLKVFYNQRNEYVGSMTSRDDGRTWSAPQKEFTVAGETAHAIQVLLDRRGELQVYYLIIKRGGRKLGVDYFLDLWQCTTADGRTRWNEPRMAYHGAIGALRGIVQTKSGRIVIPFSTAHPERKAGPPIGYFYTTAVYSDDDGATWRESPSQLTAPCYDGYNGGNYGAVEPTVVELRDGRLWMLIRTQTGRMYESFSADGAEWSPAVPSKFYGSNSPAMFRRLDGGSLFLAWNNAQVGPKHEGQGVYSGRDALHAAISDDDGNTWRGYREVYRDPTRHGDGLELRNDRGTAYPDAVQTAEGAIVLVTGQGEGRRAIIRFDPAWLTATHREDDFSRGLEGWTAFREVGPAQRFWRQRKPAAQILPHPDDPQRKVLSIAAGGISEIKRIVAGREVVEREQEVPGGATWNFPAGRRGELTLKVRFSSWSTAATLTLGDRMFNPTDDAASLQTHSQVSFRSENETEVWKPGKWHEVKLAWDSTKNHFKATLDGRDCTPFSSLPRFVEPSAKFSYLHIRFDGDSTDTTGLLIEKVVVDVEP